MKICSRCEIVQSLDSFTAQASAPDKHRYICKTCDKQRYVWKTFGWTLSEYEEAYYTHKMCDICGSVTKPLDLDHNHGTGKIRGFLCRSCNTALGKFQDSIQILEKAIVYLQK